MRYTPPSPPPDPIDQIRTQSRARIDRFGFTKIVVGTGHCSVPGCDSAPEEYPYAYTLGMCDFLSPEFVVFGLSLEHVNDIVDPVCEAVMAARRLPVGDEHRIVGDDGPDVSLIEVPEEWVETDPDRVGTWFGLFEPRWPSFVQICWSDEQGNMPWELACNPAVAAVQPILCDNPYSIPKVW